MFRAGLIGCGNIGSKYDENHQGLGVYTHAGMYRNCPEFDLAAAADPDGKRLGEFGSFWGLDSLYSDYRRMLEEERLDILSIATPDETHGELIREVLAADPPKLIFTEKPLAGSVQEAEDIERRSRAAGVTIIVDYIRRWDRRHQEIRAFLRENGIGEILGISGYYVRGIRHNGCQLINLIRYLFGRILSVRALGSCGVGSIPGDPSLNLHLGLSCGISASVTALDRKGYAFSIFELDIIGSSGRIRLTDGGQSLEFFKTGDDPQFSNFKKLVPAVSPWERSTYPDAMKRAGMELATLLAGSVEAPENTMEEAIADLHVIEAALESGRNSNREIPVTDRDQKENSSWKN